MGESRRQFSSFFLGTGCQAKMLAKHNTHRGAQLEDVFLIYRMRKPPTCLGIPDSFNRP